MRLTLEHVNRVYRRVEDPGPPPGTVAATDDDHERAVRFILSGQPQTGEFWLFAYGSLIWNPACEFVEMRTGHARGWHRSFCLGWDRRWRGCEEQPGLMLALDRGGGCKGVLYRLPRDYVEDNLALLVRREMQVVPSAFPPRWIKVMTENGPIAALTFAMDRGSGRYVSGLTDEQIADALACAVGFRGSMAEYLFHTVDHLERMGIHDPHLWRLQELVAERIEAMERP
jgi:cation transport protein ChaC